MTPEEQSTIDQKLRKVAEILYNNSSREELATFETTELSVRGHLRGRERKIKTYIGKITIFGKQATRLKLKEGTRLSPQIEKCCLFLVGNESFVNAEKDLEILTGVNVPHSK